MSTNMDQTTSIRYGIVAAHNLDPEIVDEIQQYGTDVHWAAQMDEIRAEVENDDSCLPEDKEEEIESRIESIGDCWYDDEPVHEFTLQGVHGRTTWLGGALMVFVFKSPFIGRFDLCSPCVPNCCNGDSPNPDGYEGYMPPANWLDQSNL